MSAYRVVEIKCLHSNCWGARCSVCGAWLTKHDFDVEEASQNARYEFERDDDQRHLCVFQMPIEATTA